ncbi:MAG: hypothetical protein IPN49_16455 [Saprospiraceae bacterium]|nr:hypothetical protein [Saprospiraceae bacterium]MBK8820591.1 hypothetical protein [Saprospiraceae bacterium]
MKSLLIFLLGFLSIGAFFGGILFMLEPDGSLMGMTVNFLENSPFNNFLIPGIILLLVFGVFPVYIIYSIIKKQNNPFMQKLNVLYDYHFSWTFTVYIGIGLIIWINVESYLIQTVELIQLFYAMYGVLIICIALLPQTRKKFIM